jgi:hypothetical protein
VEAWVVPEEHSSFVAVPGGWVGGPTGFAVGEVRIGAVVVRHSRAVVGVEAGSSLCLVAGSWTCWLSCPFFGNERVLLREVKSEGEGRRRGDEGVSWEEKERRKGKGKGKGKGKERRGRSVCVREREEEVEEKEEEDTFYVKRDKKEKNKGGVANAKSEPPQCQKMRQDMVEIKDIFRLCDMYV